MELKIPVCQEYFDYQNIHDILLVWEIFFFLLMVLQPQSSLGLLYGNGSPDLCSMKQQDCLDNTAAIFSQDKSKQD
jgi:hypothetical protein